MTTNPQDEHEFTPDEIKILAKFFKILWETQKELERNEHKERKDYSSIAR